VRLVPDNVAEMAPQPNVEEMLIAAGDMARRGEIDGAVLLLSHSDGTTSDRWAFGPNFGWVPMVGCAEVWKRRFIAQYDEVNP